VRILLVTDWKQPEGGVEVYFGWLREALIAAGDEVRLLTSSAGSAAGGSAEYAARGSENRVAQTLLQLHNPFAAARVREAVHDFAPDVALVGMFELHLSPSVLSALRGTPTALYATYYKPVCPSGLKLLPNGSFCSEPAGRACLRHGCVSLPRWLRDQPRYGLIRSALSHVDRILACSRWVQRELEIGGVRSEVLPLPVRRPGPAFRRRQSPCPLFVYSGRLSDEKGLELLLRAFARLEPGARLRIVGDGPSRVELELLARRLRIATLVEFVGQVPAAAVEQYLADAWAVVAPSLWAEPLGFSVVEAIVRGVPVVASAAGGFGETVEPGASGLLFPNGDEDALLACLRRIASGDAFPGRAVCEEAAARAMRAHDDDVHLRRLREVLAQTVARRPPARAVGVGPAVG
jgi:glycosyltransferase involved in cell wall biosynthesis